MKQVIPIYGASGSGTSTLGQKLLSCDQILPSGEDDLNINLRKIKQHIAKLTP